MTQVLMDVDNMATFMMTLAQLKSVHSTICWKSLVLTILMEVAVINQNSVADPREAGARTPSTPVKTSQKVIAATLRISRVVAHPGTNFWIRYWY